MLMSLLGANDSLNIQEGTEKKKWRGGVKMQGYSYRRGIQLQEINKNYQKLSNIVEGHLEYKYTLHVRYWMQGPRRLAF